MPERYGTLKSCEDGREIIVSRDGDTVTVEISGGVDDWARVKIQPEQAIQLAQVLWQTANCEWAPHVPDADRRSRERIVYLERELATEYLRVSRKKDAG